MKANYFLLIISLFFLLVTIVVSMINSKTKSWWIRWHKYLPVFSLLLSVSFMLLSYIWPIQGNQVAQQIANLISTTFGFFTLDASYDDFIKCANSVFGDGWSVVFGIEFCTYVFLMPLIGGFFLLNFISELLPSLKLWINRKKTKYVFSELNEHSIALAEDIAKKSWISKKKCMSKKKKKDFDKELHNIDEDEKKWLKSACIVFTDAYTDKESEKSSELLMRAKRIGAICLKNDIMETTYHWRIRKEKKIVYFLMDNKEENNFTTAISLLSFENNNVLVKANKHKNYNIDMYVFTPSSECARLIDQEKKHLISESSCEKKKDAIKKKIKKESKLCVKWLNENHTITDEKELPKDGKKTICVFSTLNEQSLDLAEKIIQNIKKNIKEENDKGHKKTKGVKCPTIIFANTHLDKKQKNNSDLLKRLKDVGAICLKDDVIENSFHKRLKIRSAEKIIYYMMDDNDEENIKKGNSLFSIECNKLMKDAIKYNKKKKDNEGDKSEEQADKNDENKDEKKTNNELEEKYYSAEVYIYPKSSKEKSSINAAKERALKNVLENEFAEKNIKSHLRVKCINEYRNVVYKMLDGEENMGEKLLNDLILSQSGENKELQKFPTYRVWKGYFENSRKSKDHIIRVLIFGGGRIAKEYFKAVSWCYKMNSSEEDDSNVDKVDISVFAKNADELKSQLLLETRGLFSLYDEYDDNLYYESLLKNEELFGYDCNAHFYNVDFPSQEFFSEFKKIELSVQKILVAFGDDRLNYDAARFIKAELEKKYGISKTNNPVYIDFAIENDDLYEALKKEYDKKEYDKGDGWCHLHPFSTSKDCFSYECIRMDDLEKRGLEADRIHKIEENKTSNMYFDNNYNWKSSVAVALHTIYKCFSKVKIGNDVKGIYEFLCNQNEKEKDKKEELENKIYWLEHRRWVAYYRSEGYRCPTAKEFALMAFEFKENGNCKYVSNKDTERRLHACMLESNQKYRKIDNLLNKIDKDKTRNSLKEAIKNMQSDNSDNSMTLSDWLRKNVPDDDKKEIDDLDRLSILIMLIRGDDPEFEVKPDCDFKYYDVELGKGLIAKVLKLQIEDLYDKFSNAETGKLDNAVKMLLAITNEVNEKDENKKKEIKISEHLNLKYLSDSIFKKVKEKYDSEKKKKRKEIYNYVEGEDVWMLINKEKNVLLYNIVETITAEEKDNEEGKNV